MAAAIVPPVIIPDVQPPAPQCFSALSKQEASALVNSGNQPHVQFWAISWIGWHPVPPVALHEFSYQYGVDLDAANTNNLQRIYNYLDNRANCDRFALEDAPGTKVWFDWFSFGTDENTKYTEMAQAYSHASRTIAFLDIRDSFVIKDFVDTVESLEAYAQAGAAVEIPQLAMTAIRGSAHYNFTPHAVHSYWTRGWLAQEQIYSSQFSYVYQLRNSDPVEEIDRTRCIELQERLNTAIQLIRTFNPAHSALAVLERLQNFAIPLTLRLENDASEDVPATFQAYLRGSMAIPRQARDGSTLAKTMGILFWNIAEEDDPGQMMKDLENANNGLKPIANALMNQGIIPLPRLSKPTRDLSGNSMQTTKSPIYNTMVEYKDAAPRRFISSETLHALGKLREGNTLEVMHDGSVLVGGPRRVVSLHLNMPHLVGQPDVFPEEVENPVDQVVIKEGLVISTTVKLTIEPREYGLIHISDKYYWVTDANFWEIVGYVDVTTAGKLIPETLIANQWMTEEDPARIFM